MISCAWQHTKTSAEVELHFDSQVQKIKNSLAAHQNKQKLSYTLILIYKKLKTSLVAHQEELSYTLINNT